MSIQINDTFAAHSKHLDEVLAAQPKEEPGFVPPKQWPHQVPADKRRPEVQS